MHRPLHIVIADDDADDHLLVRQAIAEIMNCEVRSVYNGQELLEYLRRQKKFKDVTSLPDFILLDLNMPLMNGFDVLSTISSDRELKKIPIYILSTSRMEHDRQRSGELGARGFYTKPILFHQLKEIIEEITRQVTEGK